MHYVLDSRTPDLPQARAAGLHQTDRSSWKPLPQDDFVPQMRLLIRPVGELIIVKCLSTQGQFDDPESTVIRTSLMDLVRLGYVQILLDLQGMDFVSGSLLGGLARLHLELVKTDGFLRLFGVNPIVRRVLTICRLDRALEIYESEAEALSANRREPANGETGRPRQC